MHEILITSGYVSIRAILNETPSAREILKILPVRGTTQLWGNEIYFTIPISTDLESDAKQDVEPGDLGYWPDGPAMCLFFGPTPASTGPAPRAYSPVNIIGRITGDFSALKDIPSGSEIVAEKFLDHKVQREKKQR